MEKSSEKKQCRKCKVELVPGALYCHMCGTKQEVAHRSKTRGNGTGSVYQLPNKKWIAVKTTYYTDSEGKMRKRTVSRSTFKTKKDAVNALDTLESAAQEARKERKRETFSGIYEKWLPTHEASKSTLDCYKAAYKYYSPIYTTPFADITVDDLQDCIDDCTKGKRTKQNMKTLAGLLYKYAIPRNLATINMGQYITVRAESGPGKEGLPLDALKKIEDAIGTVEGADYVLCQCYLGFRPSEFISLDAKNYNCEERAFVGGAKTEAGKNRVVTVSPKIQPIVDRLTSGKASGPVFCAPDGSKMTAESYRTLFYSVLDNCGIENPTTTSDDVERHKYTPHSCRHTFATLMKRVAGDSKDKLALIGHTSESMLRHYQDVDFDDLRKITDSL